MARNQMMAFEDRLDSLKESVRDLVDFGRVRDRLGDVKESVVSGTRAGVSKTGSLIKEHPIMAIGIAFGIGFIAMRLMRR